MGTKLMSLRLIFKGRSMEVMSLSFKKVGTKQGHNRDKIVLSPRR